MTRPRESEQTSPRLRAAEVLGTAARVFFERGYASSSVQVIADELGILKGSLYYYTQSKEELLYRILKDVHDDLAAILREVQRSTAGPEERLRDYVHQQVAYAARNVTRIAVYYRDADQLSADHAAVINAERREHATFMRDLIKEGQAAGIWVEDEEASILADLVFGSFIWTYRWYDPNGALSADEVASAVARFALRALAP